MAHISIDNVSVRFPILHTSHRSLKKSVLSVATGGAILKEARAAPVVEALVDVSAEFRKGDRVGLVGPNGAGKTTLLRVLAGIYEPDEGYVDVSGSVVPLLNVTLGFDPELTGRDNLRLRGMYMGLRPGEVAKLVPEIADFTELGSYLDLPFKTYSTGMQMRLALGMATAVHPDILLMDEWLLAGDAHFVEKSRQRVTEYVEKASILVLASHSDDIIREWCNKALFLRSGRVEAFGPVDEVLDQYAAT